MRLRISLRFWETTLLSAVGLVPLACETSEDSGLTNGSDAGEAGDTGSERGGSSASGSGGSDSTGGTIGKAGSGGSSTRGGSAPEAGTSPTGTGGGEGTTGGKSSGKGGSAGAEEAGAPGEGGSPEGGSSGMGGMPGGGQGGSSQGGSSGSSGNHPFACENPQPYLDASTGFEECEDGRLRRVEEGQCASSVPREAPVDNYNPEIDTCERDADCTDAPYGYCHDPLNELVPGHYCAYGCVTDADCIENQACLCGDPVGTCVSANCQSGEDCGPGLDCASQSNSFAQCGLGASLSFMCQTEDDSCATAADCPAPEPGRWSECVTDANRVRGCSSGICPVVGRPFLVDGGERLAPLRSRADWTARELAPSLDGLDGRQRARLADAWARLGQMEHASIAAFSRFVIQLLGVGAPAVLVEQASRALGDEIRHAELCFAIASRYAGRTLGPGPLDVSGSLEELTLEAVVLGSVTEGCLGETFAAIEAAEAAEHAEDPAIESALRRIAADETRHAELAWRFVAWALEQGLPPTARERILRAFENAADGLGEERELDGDERALLARGIVPDPLRASIRRQALERAVLPSAQAMLTAFGERNDHARRPCADRLSASDNTR